MAGSDKRYDMNPFVSPCRALGMTPVVARGNWQSCLVDRKTRHAGYKLKQRKRKRVEDPFGWVKTYGLLGKLRHHDREKVHWLCRFTATAYNLTRIKGLLAWDE
jgi:hypothetical protein